MACRSVVSAPRRASFSRFCSGVLLVSPLGRRTNGLPMANAGWATRLRQLSRLCAMRAQSMGVVGGVLLGFGVVLELWLRDLGSVV